MTQVSFEDSITLIDAFDTMRYFLERYWERGGRQSDDIAILLGSLDRDESSKALPLDTAMWEDWLNAVSHTTLRHG